MQYANQMCPTIPIDKNKLLKYNAYKLINGM